MAGYLRFNPENKTYYFVDGANPLSVVPVFQEGQGSDNPPIVDVPDGSLTEKGLVQLSNEVSDSETVAATPKAVNSVKTELETKLTEVKSKVDESSTKLDEVTESLEDTVKYSEFQNPNDDAPRKTIQLANHDTISGITTTGAGANLVMLSKWDKADFGSPQITMNLNTKDQVTINDSEVILTNGNLVAGDNITITPDDGIPQKFTISTTIPEVDTSNLVTKDELEEVKTEVSELPHFLHDEVNNKDTIQLKNHDSISGLDTNGNGYNIAMVSKWNKVDLGSASIQMNLNSINGQVQINDEKIVATTDDVATAKQEVIDQIPHIDNLATRDELATKLDTSEFGNKFTEELSKASIDTSKLVGVISVDNLPATSISTTKIVDTDDSRFQLTDSDVQNGDVVKVEETGSLYFVKDSTKLDSDDGYVEFNASVDWSSITNKPTEFKPEAHTHNFSELEGTENVVQSLEFEYDGVKRSTIQLKNYDSISGIGTDGQGYNIAMVSKWDKVDLGTPSLTMNLNSKDGIVQINDEKVIATTDDISNANQAINEELANKANKDEIPTKLPNPESLTIKYNGVEAFTYDGSESEVGNFIVNSTTVPVSDSDTTSIKDYVDTNVQTINEALDSKADKVSVDAVVSKVDELDKELDTTVKFSRDEANNKDTIQLKNHDSISGISTTGAGYNLIMVSKWDKVDVGSSGLQMNLNSPDGIIQVNDEKVLATTDQIPDVSGLATKEEIPTSLPNPNALTIKYNGIEAFTYDGSKAEVGNFTVTADTVPGIQDKIDSSINEAKTEISSEIDSKISEKLTSVLKYKGSVDNAESLPSEAELGDVYNVLDTGDNYAFDGTNWDKLSGVVDLSNYYTKEEVDTSLESKQDVGDYVEYQSFQNPNDDAPRKTIQLKNHDTISGIGTDGTGYNIAMVSKWDKVDLGAPSLTMNLNSKDGVVQINDEKVVATVDQIPDVSNFVTTDEISLELDGKQDKGDYALKSELPDISGKLDSSVYESDKPTFALKTELPDLTPYAKNEDLVYIADTVIPEMNTNTAKALDTKVDWDESKKVISLPKDGSISALRDEETLEGGNLLAQRTYDEGVTYVTEVGTTKNKLTLNADERPQIDLSSGKSEKVAYESELSHMIQIPIRSLKDQVYSKEDILGWFNVEDDVELKGYIAGQVPLFVKYGITLSYNPHFYKFPVEYIAYESANQLKLVFTGLDTSDDSPVKYEIIINLDGTVISGNSNVQMTLLPISEEVDLSGLATKDELSSYALKTELPDVSQFIPESEIDSKISGLGVYDLGNFSLSVSAENKAKEDGIYNNINYKVLTYTINNTDVGYIINNVASDKTTQFLFLKGVKYTRDVVNGEATSWVKDDYSITLPNKSINGTTFFKLTTDSTSDDIKTAMSASGQLITEDDLNQCITKGYTIKEYSMQSGSIFVGFSGQGFTFTYIGFPNPVQTPALMSVVVKIEGDTYSVLSNGVRGVILTSANIASNSTITSITGRLDNIDKQIKPSIFDKYIEENAYSAQFIQKLEESYISDLGTPENIDGQPYDSSTNNYTIGMSYLTFGYFDESFVFHYDLWSVNSDSIGFVFNSVCRMISTLQTELDSKFNKIEERLSALEGA